MFKLLIDTCVWLDLAKDNRQTPLLSALEELVRLEAIELIVPEIVVSEFQKNKKRVLEDSKKNVTSTLKQARRIFEELGHGKGKTVALRFLEETSYKIPTFHDNANGSMKRIEKLIARFSIIDADDEIIVKAGKRAIDGKAPFHSSRNSMGDAIIIETYAKQVNATRVSGQKYAFVTHNTKDFSDPYGDKRSPHPDLATYFSKRRSLFFLNLKEAINQINPELLADILIEDEWDTEPRSAEEIGNAINEFIDKVWYDRHQMRASSVEAGKTKIIPKAQWLLEGNNGDIVDYIWKGALKAAANVEKVYGTENLGPYSDFEWGMLNGKLSALRWVMGDDWDFLDT